MYVPTRVIAARYISTPAQPPSGLDVVITACLVGLFGLAVWWAGG